MITKLVLACALSAALVAGTGAATTADAVGAKAYSNCTKLNKAYPHGVGKKNAHDHVSSGTPVTNFTRNTTVYNQNTGRDRDKDGVACEKR
jgi:hypothetical protein